MNARLLVFPCLVVLFTALPLAAQAKTAPFEGRSTAVAPAAIAVTADAVFMADVSGHRILRYQLNGDPAGSWGVRGAGPGELDGPFALGSDPAGHLYVADTHNHRIQKFSSDGRFLASWGARGPEPGQFEGPMGIAIDDGGAVYVTDLDNHRVQKFSSDGVFMTSWGSHGAASGEFVDPWGIAIDHAGFVLVADHGNHRVQKFTREGAFVDAWGTAGDAPGLLLGPIAIVASQDGSVFVTDLIRRRVQQFSSEGALLSVWEEAEESTSYRWGLALDETNALYAAHGGKDSFERIERDAFAKPAAPQPLAFTLARVWPNPSMGSTMLRFGIPASGRFRVEVFGVDGRRVRRLADGSVAPGEARIEWDGRTEQGRLAAAGIYFVRGWLESAGARRALEGRIVRLR